MKKLFLLFSLSTSTAMCQDTRLSVGVNYSGYQLSDIKLLRDDFKNQIEKAIPVKTSILDDFPSTVGYEVSLLVQKSRVNIGGFASFNSSGSRIFYGDYSGKIIFDQLLSSIGLGAQLEYHTPKKNKTTPRLTFTSKFGVSLNSYDIDYRVQMGQISNSEKLSFNSTNIFFMPGIGVHFKVNRFFVQPEFRYFIDIPGNIKLSSNSNLFLNKPSGGVAGIDWSGFRLCLSAGIEL